MDALQIPWLLILGKSAKSERRYKTQTHFQQKHIQNTVKYSRRSFKPLAIFPNCSILDISQGSEHNSVQ